MCAVPYFRTITCRYLRWKMYQLLILVKNQNVKVQLSIFLIVYVKVNLDIYGQTRYGRHFLYLLSKNSSGTGEMYSIGQCMSTRALYCVVSEKGYIYKLHFKHGKDPTEQYSDPIPTTATKYEVNRADLHVKALLKCRHVNFIVLCS